MTLPLRTPEERVAFCDTYFAAVGAKCLYRADDYREYELPRDVDKELTDRPYYWLWVEQTGQQVPPTVLRLAFTPEAMERENHRLREEALASASYQHLSDLEKMFFRPPAAELCTLGSFRMDKLYQSVDQRGRFAAVQPTYTTPGTKLVPWLLVNILVTRRSDLNQQELRSLGVCLVNRQIVEHFYDIIHRIEMQPASIQRLLETATVGIEDGVEIAKRYVEKRLHQETNEWADEARERLRKDLDQIRTYYQSLLPDAEPEERRIIEAELFRKEQELIERGQPRIELDMVQMALVGLVERFDTPRSHEANHRR